MSATPPYLLEKRMVFSCRSTKLSLLLFVCLYSFVLVASRVLPTHTHFIFYVSNLSFFRSLSLPLLCSFFHILSLPSNKNRRQDNRRFLFSLRFFFSLARANDLLRIVAILNPANVAISLKSLCTSRAMPKDDNPSNDSYFYPLA